MLDQRTAYYHCVSQARYRSCVVRGLDSEPDGKWQRTVLANFSDRTGKIRLFQLVRTCDALE